MNNRLSSKPRQKIQLPIVVVSGLPRSGTSLMMQMLEAGGMTALTDGERKADTHNPKGYYEFESVKQLYRGETRWLGAAQGKVVKIVSNFIPHLPSAYTYKVIFMRRHLDEVVRSQEVMRLDAEVSQDHINTPRLTEHYKNHLVVINRWMQQQENVDVLYVDYNLLVNDPERYISSIVTFLDDTLHQEDMFKVINPTLYRQRILL